MRVPSSRYVPTKVLGRGSFGVVVKARDLEAIKWNRQLASARNNPSSSSGNSRNATQDGDELPSMPPAMPEFVAIKRISHVFHDVVGAKRVLRELRFLRCLRHPNVLSVTDALCPESLQAMEDMYLIMPFMDTDLHAVVQSAQSLSGDHLRYFMYQIVLAVVYLHNADILHRDLKPGNILVNKDCQLKIADFGLARVDKRASSQQRSQLELEDDDEDDPDGVYSSTTSAMTEHVVTRWYRPPEVILSLGHYTKALDIWSVGCIFAEIAGRRPLFPGKNHLHQLQLITEVLGKPAPEDIATVQNDRARRFLRKLPPKRGTPLQNMFPFVDSAAIDLMSRMLVFNPDKRITAQQALAHPYFRPLLRRSDQYQTPPRRLDVDFERDTKLTTERLRLLIYQDIVMVTQQQRAARQAMQDQLHAYSLGKSPSGSSITSSTSAVSLSSTESSQSDRPATMFRSRRRRSRVADDDGSDGRRKPAPETDARRKARNEEQRRIRDRLIKAIMNDDTDYLLKQQQANNAAPAQQRPARPRTRSTSRRKHNSFLPELGRTRSRSRRKTSANSRASTARPKPQRATPSPAPMPVPVPRTRRRRYGGSAIRAASANVAKMRRGVGVGVSVARGHRINGRLYRTNG